MGEQEGRPRSTVGYAALAEWAARFIESASRWLTVERITAHATIAAALVWLMYVFNLTTPGLIDRLGHLKGADFLQFYTAGTFVKTHQLSSLYDVSQFLAVSQRATPGVPNWHYLPVYPPQTAFLFWPFAYFPYFLSYLLFSLLNLSLYAVCVAILAKLFPRLARRRFTLVMSAMAFPPFFNAVAHGQVSILALTCITFALWAYLRGNGIGAGLALGCTAFKPPIFASFAVALLAVQAIDMIAGMAIAGLAQFGLVLVFAGLRTMQAYARFGATLPRLNDSVLAVKPYQMHSLRGFWALLGTGPLEPIFWLASSLFVLVILARHWRRQTRPDWRFATLIIAAVLIDPHLYIYDAVMLAPALAISIMYALEGVEGRRASVIIVAVYLLFATLFLGPLSRITHLQLSVLVLLTLFFALTAESKREVAIASPQSTGSVG